MILRAGTIAVLLLVGCLGVLGLFFGLIPVASILQSVAVNRTLESTTRGIIITADDRRALPASLPRKQQSVWTPPPNFDVMLPAPSNTESKSLALQAPANNLPAPKHELLPSSAPIAAPPNPAADLAVRSKEKIAGFSILQIGDSHTAADFFSGEVRRRLQEIYGNGGPGYIIAGRPHIGVLSASLKITESKGWTYEALQKSDDASVFWLSGFNAVAKAAGETMTFALRNPAHYDVIEFEVVRQPGGGSIEIHLDRVHEGTYDLSSDRVEPVVIRLVPKKGPTDSVHRIVITTKNEGVVRIASVGIYDTQAGITYNSVGYPGATIKIVNKLDKTLFASDLKRLNPQIVVLAFGTNEGAKEKLNRNEYAKDYERVIDKVRAALPATRIVLIGPPDGSQLPSHCKGDDRERAICHADKDSAAGEECAWHRLPKLDMVREVQREIARRQNLAYWNWASVMPQQCGPHRWATMSPRLMAKDHVHFTIGGYKKSADEFVKTLVSVIDPLRAPAHASTNN